jgi:hypothetical protein
MVGLTADSLFFDKKFIIHIGPSCKALTAHLLRSVSLLTCVISLGKLEFYIEEVFN